MSVNHLKNNISANFVLEKSNYNFEVAKPTQDIIPMKMQIGSGKPTTTTTTNPNATHIRYSSNAILSN